MSKEELQEQLRGYQGLKPRKAVKASKRQYRLEKKAFKQLKVDKADKEALKEAKRQVTLKKRVYHHQLKRNGGTRKAKLAKRAHGSSRKLAESAVADHDVMGEVASKRQSFRKAKYSYHKTKQLSKGAGKVGAYIVKSGYGLSNRFYNKLGGRGFTRTPKSERWESQLAYRLKRIRMRVGRTKVAKASTNTLKVIQVLTSPIKHILTNPLSLTSYVIGFVLLILMSVFMGLLGANPIQQDEFSLNQSWLHISRMDRKESTDKVDYYTDIDSILLYMNYRYGGEWEPDANWDDGRGGKLSGVLGFNHFSDALDDIWKEENKDPNNLKTMAELYTNGKDWLKLPKDDLEEYKEILEFIKETGKYTSYQELANPFYPLDNEKAETEHLTVTQRYGYTDKDTIDPTTTLQTTGDKLYAPMPGKITVAKVDLKGQKTKTTNVIISDKDARFIFYNVKQIRVKTADSVETGVELGKVSGDTQEIAYAKRYGTVDDTDAQWLQQIVTKDVSYGFTEKTKSNNLNTWVLVNPGFYFPFVTYAQQTTVIQEASEMSGRAKQFYDLVKKKVKNATDNGIAAIVGCFGVESGVQPKRAEGDFLSPPVGASPSSWDDDKWLDIPGPAIYGGGYPNILRRGLGMGQFSDTTDGAIRNTLLREYAKKKGKKWYDMELQVDFMLEGDTPYYTKIFKEIATSNRDVDTLTAEFLAKWEGVPGNKLAQRQAIARQAISWFKQPNIVGSGSLASSWQFPEAYRSKVKQPPTQKAMTTQAGSGYPVGQCTWYAYNRLVELGEIKDLSGSYGYLGNGQDWVRSLTAKGWRFSTVPKQGSVMSVLGGFDGTLSVYGHVAVVEAVNADGSFLVSECNYNGVQDSIHWRVCRPAIYYSFAIPN